MCKFCDRLDAIIYFDKQKKALATDINVGNKAAGHGSNVPMQPNIPPMPSNTSNALEALDSVNATQFNALDSISRQAAINALERTKRIASYELHGGEVLRTFNVVLNSLINIMSLLPPANCSEFPNNSDTISRQAAIDEIKEIYEWHDNVTKERIIEHFKQLPPAQPAPSQVAKDIARILENGQDMRVIGQERIRGRWTRDNACSECGCQPWFSGDIHNYNFCPNCGADMRGEQDDKQRSD